MQVQRLHNSLDLEATFPPTVNFPVEIETVWKIGYSLEKLRI